MWGITMGKKQNFYVVFLPLIQIKNPFLAERAVDLSWFLPI